MSSSLPNNRYGVEAKVPTVHFECESLGEVLTLLDGQAGIARVFDRHSQTMLLDGAVKDVREALGALSEVRGDNFSCEARPARRDLTLKRDGVQSRSYQVEVSGALSITSAYYFGDLGGVVRRKDCCGEATYFRPMITRMRSMC